MTNLIHAVSLSFSVFTNWTGHQFDGKELGYVATNHVLTATYEGKEYSYTLKATASDVAVWRPSLLVPTNDCFFYTNVVIPYFWNNR